MTNKETFLEICKNEIHRDGIADLLAWIETSDFFTAPASTKYHGNYSGGLCEHSLNVYNTLKELCSRYLPDISQETIAIVALFHDLCKISYYKIGTRNVKDEDGKWYSKEVWEVDEKVPLGHGEKSCIILQWYMALKMDELLAIRWHMGFSDNDFKGGGHSIGNAFDKCPLAVLVHCADLISSNLFEETKN